MKTLFVIVICLHSVICFGQKVSIEKLDKGNDSHLSVVIKEKQSVKRYFVGCGLKDITLLPDSTKIRLIGNLLSYTTYTAKCFAPVTLLSNHYMGKKNPISKEYNLQIDALILINYIAFSSNAFIFSPYTLLYDKENKKEICCKSKALYEVIDIYKEWYKNIQTNGFVNYSYPLLNGRYEWFGSKTQQKVFKRYPEWLDFYSCKELE